MMAYRFAKFMQTYVWLLAIWACAFGGVLGGAESARGDSVPLINAHSKLRFGVYKGDKVTVEVQASGDHVEAKWVKSGETFCRAFRCEIDTSNWSLGTHKMTFVVLNQHGSLFLRYAIKILAAPAGYKPGKVEPVLIEASESIEQVSEDDLAVRTTAGRGFSYHNKKIQVVGPLPRALEWTEKLRTRAGSTMIFGKANGEVHTIDGEAGVVLAKTASNRRAIILQNGVLRSRQLNAQDPQWSVIVGQRLQVDTNSLGDVLVEKSATAVTVTVLRGYARIFHRNRNEGQERAAQGQAIIVPQGLQVVFAENEQPGMIRPTLPLAKATGRNVRATTPFYAGNHSMSEDVRDQTLLGERQPKSFKEAVQMASEAVDNQDFFLVIEALKPFAKEAEANYRAMMLLGQAYMGSFLYEDAFNAFLKAAKLNAKSPEPAFMMGRMYLAERGWKNALKFLQKAEQGRYPDSQLLNYYLGVAHLRLHQTGAARKYFETALWSEGSPEVQQSAQEFLRFAEDDRWLDLHFGLAALYDSNVLRAGSSALEGLPSGIDKVRSAGYRGHAGFRVWALRSRAAQLGFSFDIERTEWVEKELKDMSFTDQTLNLHLGLAFGGEDERQPLMSLKLDTYAVMHFIGEDRAIDRLGTRVEIGAPIWWDLSIFMDNAQAIDPLPGRDDVYDPMMEEIVMAGDRSQRIAYYGLHLKPYAAQAIEVSLGVKAGGGTFRDELQRDENYQDLVFSSDLGYAFSMRNKMFLDLEHRNRRFEESSDKRKDSRLSYGLGWHWRYTTNFYQTLSAHLESQKSSRDANAYARQLMACGLRLDF